MDVCKCTVPSHHGVTLNNHRAARSFVRLVKREERWKAFDHLRGDLLRNCGGTEPSRIVPCMVLKPMDNDRIAKPEKKIYALKSKKKKLRIEEQKEKLRIEEQKEKLRIEEREEKLRFKQLRLDEQKRKDEFELEKLRIQLGADTSKESDTKFLVKEVSKFIHRFDLKEDISLYLKLFERQAQRLNIDQENWVSHLLGLLPTEVSHIIAREPDDKANSYEHVKDLLLKRFKLTPEKFRQLFITHQKAPERTWIDFYHELNTYFNG
ncbi:uncharacterized protein TNCV_3264111 [Trichonephila clavipes]|nr:uncharacterized protein TNCV_3264111 [Trichonephila clavipes]